LISASWRSGHLGFCGACIIAFEGIESVIIPTDSKSDISVKEAFSGKDQCLLSPSCSDAKAYGMVMALQSFTNNGTQYLLAGYEDGRVSLWDLTSQLEISSLRFYDDSIMCLGFSQHLSRGVVGSTGDELHSFSLTEDMQLTQLKTVQVSNAGLQCCVFRKDAKIIASGGWDGRVRVFRAKSMQPLAVLILHADTVQCAAFADDNTLVTGSKDKNICVWSIYK
jgi:WD40 repeat protein